MSALHRCVLGMQTQPCIVCEEWKHLHPQKTVRNGKHTWDCRVEIHYSTQIWLTRNKLVQYRHRATHIYITCSEPTENSSGISTGKAYGTTATSVQHKSAVRWQCTECTITTNETWIEISQMLFCHRYSFQHLSFLKWSRSRREHRKDVSFYHSPSAWVASCVCCCCSKAVFLLSSSDFFASSSYHIVNQDGIKHRTLPQQELAAQVAELQQECLQGKHIGDVEIADNITS